MEEYNYTNAYGYHKKLVVYPIGENGLRHVELWCWDNGEWCGCGDFTEEELAQYLDHFGVEHD